MNEFPFPTTQPDHKFMLRCWQESAENGWRYRLEDPATGNHWSFSDLPSMIAFLERQTIGDDPFDRVFDSTPPRN